MNIADSIFPQKLLPLKLWHFRVENCVNLVNWKFVPKLSHGLAFSWFLKIRSKIKKMRSILKRNLKLKKYDFWPIQSCWFRFWGIFGVGASFMRHRHSWPRKVDFWANKNWLLKSQSELEIRDWWTRISRKSNFYYIRLDFLIFARKSKEFQTILERIQGCFFINLKSATNLLLLKL